MIQVLLLLLILLESFAGTPCKYTTPLQGLTALVATTYLPGCFNVACGTAQIDEAKKIAAAADATVLIVGIDQSIEAEGRDRVSIQLPGQQPLLITEVAKASKGNVILVVMSGGGFDISFAKNDDKITSILWVGYPGEAGGAAIADVIFGFYNPSKSISPWISFQLIRHFSFWYKSYNHESLSFRWKATYDMVSSVVCRQGSDDKYEYETRSCQWLSWSDLPVLHWGNHLHIWRWTKLHPVQPPPYSST